MNNKLIVLKIFKKLFVFSGDYSLTWKKDNSVILYVMKGSSKGIQVQKVFKDKRMRLKGTSLIISNLHQDDSRAYSCELQLGHDKYKPRVIHHTITVKGKCYMEASKEEWVNSKNY